MKKTFIILMLMVLFLTGCSDTKEKQFVVYSFYGENEILKISNGTIIFSDSEDVFYGGHLQLNNSNSIKNIAAYKATFYTMIDGQQEIIHTDELSNISSSELLNIDFGKKVFDNSQISNHFNNVEKENGNLWCQLKITDIDGNSNSYIIELKPMKIS